MDIRIGIRREDKNPWERRAPLIPAHVRELIHQHSLEIWLQPSAIRIFSNEDYVREGAKIEENLSPCSIILAIKEIPLDLLERKKVYIFFSHMTKGQTHNMPALKRMIELECTLIDYEKIVDERGFRLVLFGKQAGLAGMIDTLWALGQRLNWEKIENPFSRIKQAFEYQSLINAKEEIEEVGWKIDQDGLSSTLVPFLCGFAGYGNVSQGAQEIFDLLPFEVVAPQQISTFYREKNYSAHKIYKVVFKEEHMVAPVSSGGTFDLQDYYESPQKYKPVFESYLPYLAVLVNCIYWEPKYPRFVTKKFLKELYRRNSLPRLRVIGDISCDVDGSVECTIKATNPDNPVFTYDPLKEEAKDGFEGRGPVIMAIDNLPAEISLESSISFSKALKNLIPAIAAAGFSSDFTECHLPNSVKKAVILYQGKFTPNYSYMKNFL
jgi:saccharopine dehydrogenase (NAD+, L-lysine-forming)